MPVHTMRHDGVVDRIMGKVACMQPLKVQASLRASDLVRKHKLLDIGHRFGKLGVLATMPGKCFLRTSSGHQMPIN